MPVRELLLDENGQAVQIAERDSSEFAVDLLDEVGAFVPVAALSSVKLTLYDDTSGTVMGLWDHRSVLNVNGGTVTQVVVGDVTTTHLIVPIAPADNAMVGTERTEWHVFLLEVEWNAGAQRVAREYEFRVINLTKIA